MHVAVDLNWFLQLIVTALLLSLGLLHLVRTTAARYFAADSPDAAFDSSAAVSMASGATAPDPCAVCYSPTKKHCSACKMVKYCSEVCQKRHWQSGHNKECKDLKSHSRANSVQSTSALRGKKLSLVPASGRSKILKQPKDILFPYEEFVKLFNWDKAGFPPCGLMNCGNSCFANVVLQCLSYTRPLVAYVLEKGHKRECQREDWCFLCEFQTHIERAGQSLQPFSPMNILSRLPNIGSNLGYGSQEDAHEFMRFAIDTMQSVCLDEFGGEKYVRPSVQETTLIQHIFGGQLQSQVICTKCCNVSNQFENMMDLTVEIHGDAASLEECLDQFTAKESLHGDNMYKCDGCNDYVTAWKRLAVRQAPNILTIALKRFQSGRFGKLNKRVTFPETLDLTPYMSTSGDGKDVYKLYAVIVHVDMLNASFFGHYICYVKDFRGNWYRIDDCKVTSVELDEVLSQGAYMLLYSRICVRASCLLPAEPLKREETDNINVQEVHPSPRQHTDCFLTERKLDGSVGPSLSANGIADPSLKQPSSCTVIEGDLDNSVASSSSSSVSADLPLKQPTDCSPTEGNHVSSSGLLSSASGSASSITSCEEESVLTTDSFDANTDIEMVDAEANPSVVKDVELHQSNGCSVAPVETNSHVEHAHQMGAGNISRIDKSSTGSDVHDIKAIPSISTPQMDAGNVSLIDTSSTQSDVDDMEVTSIEGNGLKSFSEIKTEDSSDSQIHKFENGSKVDNVSVSPSTTGEVLNGVNSINSNSLPEIAKSINDLQSHVSSGDALKKTGRENCNGPKLKPLFSPGFLGKTRVKSVNRDSQIKENGVAKTGPPFQNGSC